MLVGGIALTVAAAYFPPVSIALLQNLVLTSQMLEGIGITTALAATAGLLNPLPNDPSNIGPEGQLPIQTPNPLWRVVYGIFQFAGSVTFADGPILDWIGTLAGDVCVNQYVHFVHTLTAHQIAGFLAVVIDGQTFNFGTDLVLLTAENNTSQYGYLGNPGLWGFTNTGNAWVGQIYFEFDAGDPGNAGQPFPFLVSGATMTGEERPEHSLTIGSTRWTASCLQRGRSKVHVMINFTPVLNDSYGPPNGAMQPYVMGSGRIPEVQFKIAGRIILDYRIVTAWQAGATYPQFSYVLALANGSVAGGTLTVFVQQNSSGVSGATAPNFAGVAAGASVADGTCSWKNCFFPIYAAGSGQTSLNNPASNKLGGPGGSVLIADSWQGGVGYVANTVIESPIGWLQMATTVGVSGSRRPNFATGPNALGVVTDDGTMAWTCLGRSQYATMLPDPDGTTNTGGISNPALCIADYLQTQKNEFGLGASLTLDSVDTVVAAANVCDEAVVIAVY
jgi:hypothetical protein